MFSMCQLRLWICLQHLSPRKIIMDLSKPLSAVQYIGYVSNLILVTALGLGLYARWLHSEDLAVLLIAFLGLFVFAISSALVYYFSMETIGICVARLWIGCLIGVVSFTMEHSKLEHESLKTIIEVMDILFISSLVFRCVWNIVDRFVQPNAKQAIMVDKMDCMEMVGLAISSIVTGKDFVSISLMTLALGLAIINIRLKSVLGFLNLTALVTVMSAFFFPKLLEMPANPYALCCFLGRVTFEPFIDIFLSPLTKLQRWEPLTSKSSFMRRLFILAMMVIEVTFFVFCAKQIPGHKEWFVVVPMFGAFSLLWFLFHLVFLIIVWQLNNKLTECNTTYRSLSEENRNMLRILESKGVRHFALISQRLAFVTLITTVVIGGLHWTTKTGVSLSLWFINLPLEAAIVSLLWTLGNVLGGTCVGYALVAPSVYTFNRPKTESSVGVLSTDLMQEISNKATRTLNKMQQFFAYNLIDTYGCDFSSSGLTLEAVESKLKIFLQRATSDGPRYDTYLVYYSGPVHDNGDWALLGEERLTFATLLTWWQECNRGSDSRLIMVCDTEHSLKWIRHVIQLRHECVGLQATMLVKGLDAEEYAGLSIGDFTDEWTDFNSANTKHVNWRDRRRCLRPVFGISRAFPDFTFHRPTDEDIAHYWDANFPRVTKPLIRVTNFRCVNSLMCVCYFMMACLNRCRILFLAPKEFDTGHGFKLVR